jgi:competence protein ComEC
LKAKNWTFFVLLTISFFNLINYQNFFSLFLSLISFQLCWIVNKKKKSKHSFLKLISVSLILFVFILIKILINEAKKQEEINFSKKEKIEIKIIKNEENFYIIKNKNNNFILYKNFYYQGKIKFLDAIPYQKLKICGYFKKNENNQNHYLKNNNIKGILKINNKCYPKINENNIDIRFYFHKFLRKKIENNQLKLWLNLIWKNENNKKINEIKIILENLGIVWIIIISGFHLRILKKIIDKLFWFIKTKKGKIIISIIPISILTYLLEFSIPISRAYFTFLINSFFYIFFKRKLNNWTTFNLTLIIFLIFNPFFIYSFSFQLTFLITFLIINIFEQKNNKSNFKNIILLNWYLFWLIIPYQLIFNQKINLFSFLNNILLTVPIIFLLMIINSLIFFPFLLKKINIIFLILKKILLILVKFEIKILLFKPNLNQIFWYWSITFFIFWSKKQLEKIRISRKKVFLFTLISLNLNFDFLIFSGYNFPYYQIYMLNVGNAMSIFITSPYKKNNILIDAGIETQNNENPYILNFLKSKGVYVIDYLFITHMHNDHMNNLKFLKSKINIKKIINNKNNQKNYQINNFNLVKDISFSHKNETKNLNENNRSLVLLFNFYQFNFLITGDIENKTQDILIEDLKKEKIDILQFPHHGSMSSFNKNFLNIIKPEITLISAKKEKRKNFPNEEILLFLKKINCKIYATEINNNIEIKIKKNKIYVNN